MKTKQLVIIGGVAAAAALVYLRSGADAREEPALLVDEAPSPGIERREKDSGESAIHEAASAPSGQHLGAFDEDDSAAPGTQEEAIELTDDSTSLRSKETSGFGERERGSARAVFTASIANGKMPAATDHADFLSRNALASADGWRQLPELAAGQIDETLKGNYDGVIRLDDGNVWRMHLSIDGAVHGGRFDGQMKLELTDHEGRSFSTGEPRGDLAAGIRVAAGDGFVSVLLSAQGQDPSRVYQLFFGEDSAAEVIGNLYLKRNGHLMRSGSVLLRRIETDNAEQPF